MENIKKSSSKFLDRFIDFLFSKDPRKYLLLILFLGMLLRFFVANDLPPGPDEMVHGTHAIGFINLKALSTMTQGPLWFFLTDLSYKLFNITLFSARFLSFFFGSLSIILVFLISDLLFNNKKIALISAFLLAVSPYHITNALVYMDESMMFFILFAAYFFIKEYKENQKISLLSALFLGLGLLIKIIAGVFSIVFAFFILGILVKNYKSNKNLFKENLKKALSFCGIILILFLPVISYNYFLYKEKGITDLPFSMYFGINTEFYQGPGLAHETGFSIANLPHIFHEVFINYFIKQDVLLFLIGIFGIILSFSMFKKEHFPNYFLLTLILFPLIFIMISILLPTHYTSFLPLFSIFGGLFIYQLSKKFGNTKNILIVLLAVILLINIYHISASITSRSAIGKMRDTAISSIDDNTLVVVDSRIYRGTIAWMFNDKHYLESSFLFQVFQYNQNISGKVNLPVIFIECLVDDCGWGTIKDQPEFNESSEQIVSFFENISKQTDVSGGGINKEGWEMKNQPYFRIHRTMLSLNPIILKQADTTHSFFFYPVKRYLDPTQSFDYYQVGGVFDSLLEMISYLVFYLSVLCSLLSIILLFYILHKNK